METVQRSVRPLPTSILQQMREKYKYVLDTQEWKETYAWSSSSSKPTEGDL